MVVFAGTTIYSPNPTPVSNPALQPQPQLGIDVTCVDERSRRGTSNVPQTGKELADFVDIFAEVFSVRELDAMKSGSCRGGFASEAEAVKAGLRLFYTYWALKEAYIKMTGEALLAKWLTRLEFVDVVAPAPAPPGSGPWGEQYTGIKTLWYGVEKEEARLEVVAFEEDYIVATAARGGGVGPGSEKDRKRDPWEVFEGIDIERDVASCARGRCRCLEG